VYDFLLKNAQIKKKDGKWDGIKEQKPTPHSGPLYGIKWFEPKEQSLWKYEKYYIEEESTQLFE